MGLYEKKNHNISGLANLHVLIKQQIKTKMKKMNEIAKKNK